MSRNYPCSRQARHGMAHKLVDYVARHQGHVRVRDLLIAKGWEQVAGHFAVGQAERSGYVTTEMAEGGVQYLVITETGLQLAAEVADAQLRKRKGAYA